MKSKASKWLVAALFLAGLLTATLPAVAELDKDTKIAMEAIEETLQSNNNDIDALKKMLGKIKWGADLRWRYELFNNYGKNTNTAKSLDRERYRVRLRFNSQMQVNDITKINMQLATGGTENISTNQTMDKWYENKPFYLDIASFEIAPKDMLLNPKLIGGKMKNPFFIAGGSQLIWDGDLTLEGAALSVNHKVLKPLTLFASGGHFFISELSGSTLDLTNNVSQLGFDYKDKFINRNVRMRAAAGHVKYHNLKGANLYGGKGYGNSDASGKFKEDFENINLAAQLEVANVFGVDLVMFYDWAKNVLAPVQSSTNLAVKPGSEFGYLAGLEVKSAKLFPRKDMIRVKYMWRECGKDAVVGALTDSDFGGGGTDSRGHVTSITVGLMDNVSGAFTYFANQQGMSQKYDSANYERVQADLSVSFK
jgi:hypothetical protein